MLLGIQAFFINQAVAGISVFALYWLVVVKYPHLSLEMPLAERLKFYEESLFTSLMFAAMFTATLFTQNISIVLGVLVASVLLRQLAIHRLRKKIGRVATT